MVGMIREDFKNVIKSYILNLLNIAGSNNNQTLAKLL